VPCVYLAAAGCGGKDVLYDQAGVLLCAVGCVWYVSLVESLLQVALCGVRACVWCACVCQEYAFASVEWCGEAPCCGLTARLRRPGQEYPSGCALCVQCCLVCFAVLHLSVQFSIQLLLVSSSPAWIWHVQASISGSRVFMGGVSGYAFLQWMLGQ
jgi:hypothetical protein